MKKKILLEAKGASDKQWSVLVLELNIMKSAWKKFGVTLSLKSPDAARIIAWGNKNYDQVKHDKDNSHPS
tara:strand:- start:152 stop:361 length:210 start_codon:yes stop_codon:yes gene_type:complete